MKNQPISSHIGIPMGINLIWISFRAPKKTHHQPCWAGDSPVAFWGSGQVSAPLAELPKNGDGKWYTIGKP